MSSAEFEDWFQYYHEQPFGSKRDNMHAAFIASTLRNVFRSANAKTVDWQDFMLVREADHRKEALGKAINHLLAIAVTKKELKRRKKRDRSRKARRKARSRNRKVSG